MKKRKFSNFISKYFLNGSGAESVLIDANEVDVKTIFVGPERSVVGFVQLKEPNNLGKLGVYNTLALNKLLSAFNDDDELNITPNINSMNMISSLTIECGNVKANATLSDTGLIPDMSSDKFDTENMCLTTEPAIFDVEFKLTPDFIDQFKRYASAVDSDIFAFDLNIGQLNLMMNYSENNVNSIKFSKSDAICNTSEKFKLTYKTGPFMEIFNANKGIEGTLYISSNSMVKLVFDNSEYKCTYYVFKVNVN